MRGSRFSTYMVLAAVVVGLCGVAGADDKSLLSERAAPPNIIFILDSSGSMAGGIESMVATPPINSPEPQVPGSGDETIAGKITLRPASGQHGSQ